MKAVVFTKYGSPEVLVFKEVEKPAPKHGEVLIRIHATTAAAGDCELRASKFPLWLWLPIRLWMGVFRPRKQVLGQELSGEVEAVGEGVTRFKQGDLVFASTGFGLGAYAQYRCLPENPEGIPLAKKPRNMSHAEAAAVPVAGLEALHFLREGQIRPGEKVLINGAGGGIGSFAVQLAKYYGAEVTGVDRTGKLDGIRSMGADDVIDFTKDDFAERAAAYDVIMDVAGGGSLARSLPALKANGRLLLANPSLKDLVRKGRASKKSGKRIVAGPGKRTSEDLDFLRGLIEAGRIKSLIDRCYALEEAAEAHRYVESGQKRGHVVLLVAPAQGAVEARKER